MLAPLLAVVMLAAVVLAGYKLYPRFHTADYSGAGAGEVTVRVPSGASAFSLAPELVQLGVVASTRAFVNAANASSNPDGLQPGYYSLHKHMKASLAYALLLSPSARIQTVVTIPEGLRLSQILSLLQAKAGHSLPATAYADAIKDTAALGLPAYAHGNPEGYLFPATYDINPGQSPLAVLQEMVASYNQQAQSLNLTAAAQAGHMTPGQIVTIASILEAEAGAPKYYAAGRRGDLQPAEPGHEAGARQHRELRAEQVRDQPDPDPDARELAVQHVHPHRAPARPDRQPGRRGHPGVRCTRPMVTCCTS